VRVAQNSGNVTTASQITQSNIAHRRRSIKLKERAATGGQTGAGGRQTTSSRKRDLPHHNTTAPAPFDNSPKRNFGDVFSVCRILRL